MSAVPKFEYIEGANKASISLWVTENKELLDLSAFASAAVDVYDDHDESLAFTKTTGITLATGSGTQQNGTPNCQIDWATLDEITQLDAGGYKAILTLVSPPGDIRKRQFRLQILPST